jgi:preprotein translocase subunit YajC
MHTSLALADSTSSGSGGLLLLLLPLLLLGFLMFTQRRRGRAMVTMQASIGVGDEVVTTSGMIGGLPRSTVNEVTRRSCPGCALRFDRRAIGSRYQYAPPPGTSTRPVPSIRTQLTTWMASTRPDRGRPDGAVRTLVIFVLVAHWPLCSAAPCGEHCLSWTPKLGLDLEGGTQLVLKPRRRRRSDGHVAASGPGPRHHLRACRLPGRQRRRGHDSGREQYRRQHGG